MARKKQSVRPAQSTDLRFGGKLRSEQLREHVMQRLSTMQDGEKLPSERALALETGLSLLTVNKVLANLATLGLVSRRQGSGTYAIKANPELAGTPGNFAGAPPAGRSLRLIRFVVRDLGAISERGTTLYLAQFYRGVCEAARADGVEVLPTPFSIGPDNVEMLPEDAFAQPNVEGLIFVECEVPDYRPLWRFLEGGKRIVGMEFAAPEQGLCSVLFDNVSGTRMMTEHALKLGHRRLCFVGPDGYVGQPLDERLEGFRTAVREAGLAPEAGRVMLSSYAERFAKVRAILAEPAETRPTAFIGYSDAYLEQVVRAARELNLKIPEDLSVAGFGGGWIQEPHAPLKADTVVFDEVEMGRKAYRLLKSGAKGVVKREPARAIFNGSMMAPGAY